MFALLHRLTEAHRTALAAGVRFCETCAEGVSTAAQRAEAAYARAQDKALTAGIRL